MGLGLLYGQPRHYITDDIALSADKLASWIEREIPSFVGNVPAEYKIAINSYLSKNLVKGPVIWAAYQILEKRGMKFDSAANDIQVLGSVGQNIPPNNPNQREAPRMNPVTKGEADRIKAYTYEEYERQYVLAIKTNNSNEAESILAAVLQLLWDLARGYSKTKTAARNEKMVEWDEFNTAVNEALSQAATLQTHVRFISNEELASMRQAETPTFLRGLTVRIASRITTRSIPPARRARK